MQRPCLWCHVWTTVGWTDMHGLNTLVSKRRDPPSPTEPQLGAGSHSIPVGQSWNSETQIPRCIRDWAMFENYSILGAFLGKPVIIEPRIQQSVNDAFMGIILKSLDNSKLQRHKLNWSVRMIYCVNFNIYYPNPPPPTMVLSHLLAIPRTTLHNYRYHHPDHLAQHTDDSDITVLT